MSEKASLIVKINRRMQLARRFFIAPNHRNGGTVLTSLLTRLALFAILLLFAGCVSTRATPTLAPAPTLPAATGIPVTPRPKATGVVLPTATVETLPTPDTVAEMFADANALLPLQQGPDTDPKALADALANGAADFLMATANGDVSMEGQPALDQLREALNAIENLPEGAEAHVAAIHTGDDQGGSRDLIFVAVDHILGLPILVLERLGATYDVLAPIELKATPEERYFYSVLVQSQDMTGDGQRELIYVLEYPGASGTTNELTVARRDADAGTWKPIFQAGLINWAGESEYQIETAADSTSIKLFFPWFGAFDHKLLAHPNAIQTWEYNQDQDRFVRQSQEIEEPKTPRQALNAGEYAWRNGDLQSALVLFDRAWTDPTLEQEDFSESKANPAAFAKFRQVMLLNLLNRSDESRKWLTDSQASGDALASLANTFARNSTGSDPALRGWIAMANAGDLYNLIYDGQAGNLDFPFEAREIYAAGAIVSTFLNTHPGAEQDPEAVWGALDALGFKPLQRTTTDLDGDGVSEFWVVTQEGGTTPNRSEDLWFIYKMGDAWRVRSLDIADTVQFEGQADLPTGDGRALRLKLPDAYIPNQLGLTWDGSRLIWLDALTLEPRPDPGTLVGGGILQDDF